MWIATYIYILIVSCALTIVFVKISMKLAVRFNVLDSPSSRKVHINPTPLLGGLGIFAGLTITVLAHYYGIILASALKLETLFPFLNQLYIYIPGMRSVQPMITGIFGCGFILFLIGLYDDKYGLSAKLKFLFEIVIALVIIHFFHIRITLFVKNTAFSYIVTVLWIVGITNSFNLLDNMDGLSAGVALISAGVFFIAAVSAGQLFVGLFLIAFIGVMIGFLRFNFPPAKIFMGDAGSLFIGFTLSVLTILGTYYIKGSAHLYPIFMPVLILGVPIYDTFSVIVIRIKNKESIFKADRNHFSHRLSRLGMSHAGVAWFIYLVTFCVAINAILLPTLREWGVLLIAIQTICMLSIITLLEYYGKINSNDKK